MFEKFTKKAIKVVMLSQEEGRRLGHNYVGTEQIFLGLVREDSSGAGKVLAEAGITLEAMRTAVENLIGKVNGAAAIEIPFTPNAKKLLEGAWNAARDMRMNYIGTEHLLISLIRLQDGKGFQILNDTGCDLKQIEQKASESVEEANELRTLIPTEHTGADFSRLRTLPGGIEKYTKGAVKVVLLATSEARRLGHGFVGVEQLLLGLVAEGMSVASKSLKDAGVHLDDARKVVEEIVGHGHGNGLGDAIPLAPRAEKVLQDALEEAHRAGVNHVSAEHILLGLLTQEREATSRILEKFAVDLKQLEQKIRAAVSQTSSEQAQSRQPEPTLTEDVLTTLVFANEEARKLKHKRTGIEHILCGLILQQGTASRALAESGIDYDKALSVVQQIHKEEPVEPKKRPMLSKLLDTILVIFRQRPFTSQAELLMDRALKETQDRGDLFVDSGHVLLALVDTSTEPSNALALLGIDKQALKDKVIDMMKKNDLPA
jgi:ATP-dependent Clp protease ATP-binding subunit ClpA